MQGSLRALMDAEAPRLLPPERALSVLSALSDQLFPQHAAGRAHGPFGPTSILLDGDTVTLTAAEPEPAYVAPELRDGGEPTPTADAYSFATLAHELLAGDLPLLNADGSATPITDGHPGFPAFAGEAIARGLQVEAVARPLPKVLFTLLRVVPVDRWPAASQPEPEPAAEPVPEPEVEEEAAPTATVETETTETETTETETTETLAPETLLDPEPEPAPAATPEPELAHEEWHRTFAPILEVPSIDWRSESDPTRPSEEVPSFAWPVREPRESHEAQEPAAELSEDEIGTTRTFAQVDDATFLHDFMDVLRAPSDVPRIEPLDDAIPAGQLEHRPGRRVRRRRKERSRSPERLQKIVLLLVLLVLIAVGAVWALTHKDGPRYDPKLQGASLSLAHPVSVRE